MAGPAEPPRLLLEGWSGSDKATAVARLVELPRRERFAVAGFLTRELRERGARVGFALETLDGRRGVLARVGVRAGPRVGRHGVSHDDLERLAIPALDADANVVVVDELGRLELTSAAFRDAVIALLDRPIALVATVHARPDPFTDELKRRPSVAVLQLTRSNRDDLPARSPGGCKAATDAHDGRRSSRAARANCDTHTPTTASAPGRRRQQRGSGCVA